MNALICSSLDGPAALSWQPRTLSTPGAGELRVRVHAASLNFGDVLLTRGRYQIRPELPFVPGMEIAGEVVEAGAGFRDAERVAAVLPEFGGFAEYVNVPAQHVFPIGDRLPWEIAACIPSVYGTAWYALHSLAQLQPGEVVLVLGAAGGVGSACVRLARKAGAFVIGAASGAEKVAAVRAAGAARAIDCALGDLRGQLEPLIESHGAPGIIFDPVGGAITREALRRLAWCGRYLVVGFAAGDIPALAANIVLLKGAAILGVNFGRYATLRPDAANAIYRTLVTMLDEDRQLWPEISARMPMPDGARALALLESRTTHGKIVLTIGADSNMRSAPAQ